MPPPPPPPPPPKLPTDPSQAECNLSSQSWFQERLLTPEDQHHEIKSKISSGQLPATYTDGVWAFRHTPLPISLLQNGPVCGLVALAMAGLVMKPAGTGVEDWKVLLKIAIEKDWTKQGEMFSVDNMLKLARVADPTLKCEAIRTEGGDWKIIVKSLLRGDIILMPYDADKNHSPSKRKGHAAHWATIHGLVVQVPSTDQIIASHEPTVHSEGRVLVELTENSIIDMEALLARSVADFFVIAHQGKSVHTLVWSLKDLLESNQNLDQVSPKILNSDKEYSVNDITNDLRGKAITINKGTA